MTELTPADLLHFFPVLMYTWSVLILGWGVVTGVVFYKASKLSLQCGRPLTRDSDKYVLWMIAAVNVFLMGFLLVYNPQTCTSWIAVVNVFYTLHLLYVSIDTARWWKTIKKHYVSLSPLALK